MMAERSSASIFIHGVPETGRSWRTVIAALDRSADLIALDLPGFAAPAPEDWTGSKEAYVEWLIERVEDIHGRAGPVHAVGHDWGFLLLLRAASLRPELFRSVAGGGGAIDPHLPLHTFWRAFAQPGFGEDVIERLLVPEHIHAMLSGTGMTDEDIAHCSWFTPGNKQITLELYRSGVHIGTEWADDLPKIVVPSMFIWGKFDVMVPVEVGRRMAARIGSEFLALEADHFWQLERPVEVAAALNRLWNRAEATPFNVLTQPDIVLPS